MTSFSDVREALKSLPDGFSDAAPGYITRLLAVIDAIEAECDFSEAHLAEWPEDGGTIYTETVREIILQHGNA